MKNLMDSDDVDVEEELLDESAINFISERVRNKKLRTKPRRRLKQLRTMRCLRPTPGIINQENEENRAKQAAKSSTKKIDTG